MATDPISSTNPSVTRIRARSHRQALDWSLVLASQGIEHGIEQIETVGWVLVVANEDHERALATIRLYWIENRHWPWRKTFPKSGMVFDGAAGAWVFLTLIFYWLCETRSDLKGAGITDGVALAHGEWWRLFTATLLHADLAHLATNAVFGFILLGLAMGRFGTGPGLLMVYVAGAGGNLVSWLVHGNVHRGMGASGVVMGALGLLTLPSVIRLRQSPSEVKFIIGGVFGGVMLFVLLGLNPEPRTDVVAHLGGFVVGVVLGILLALAPKLIQRPWINPISGFLFAGLTILTWALAVARSP